MQFVTKSCISRSENELGGGGSSADGAWRRMTIVRLTNHFLSNADIGYHRLLLANNAVQESRPCPDDTRIVSPPVIIFQNAALILLFFSTTSPYDINLTDIA